MLLNTEIIRKTDSGYKRASEIDDGQQWFADLKRRMRKEKRLAEVFYLSPSRAKALLAANPDNRKISNRTAITYADDITNGRWVFNGEPVIVSETGELNDGQHRCEAVVMAGRGIEVLLVAGVPRATRTTVDMGKARTTGDFLSMHQIENANNVAAAANMLLCFETGRLSTTNSRASTDLASGVNRPTKQEVLTFARVNMDDLKKALGSINMNKANVVSSYSRFAGILAILARRAKVWNAPVEYITAIVEGDDLKKGSIEYIVRERLLAEKARGTLGTILFMEIIVRGWNVKRTGQKVTRLTTAGFVPEVSK